jgi:hypothetical protein
MIVNKTPNGYISIWDYDDKSDQCFKRLYIDYTLTEAKQLFKKEFRVFKNKLEY